MPKKKEPDLTPAEQFKRFQEAAKEHEIEERLPEIEDEFRRVSSGAPLSDQQRQSDPRKKKTKGRSADRP